MSDGLSNTSSPSPANPRNESAHTSVSVVMPAYNEEENIERAVRASFDVLDEIPGEHEVVVVNDASTDSTLQILQRLSEEDSRLRVISLEQNTRMAGALKRGFREASKDAVLYVDSDCPVDMNELKRALPLFNSKDVVIGYRLKRREGFKRFLFTRVYNAFIRILFGLRVRDVNFAFKLFPRKVFDGMDIQARGSFIDAEILLEAARRGYQVTEFGVDYHPRTKGLSTMATFDIIPRILSEAWAYYRRQGRLPRQL